MEIEWKSQKGSPYLFRHVAEWEGVRIHRAHVMPGRMLEHANDFHEVNVAIAGSLTTSKVSACGNTVRTKGSSGNLCVTPAGQPIRARWDKPLDNLGIFVDPQFVNTAAAENGFGADVEFREVYKGSDPLVQHIGLTLLAESSNNSPAGRLFCDSLIQTLTLHLLNHYTTADEKMPVASGGLTGYRLRQVKDFIEANLEEDLSLSAIAGAAELSQFHFARAFRKTTGVTPQQYLMNRRVERAKLLLTRPELPIVEVSLRSGFKNQSHFTTLFRKYTTLTPKMWRDVKLA